MKSVFISLLLIFLLGSHCMAQSEETELIQFSGVVVTLDSLSPVPFATIMIKNTHYGTSSDVYGYFSFVAEKGDTLVFSSVGFKDSEFVVPDSLQGGRYSLIQSMSSDTISLRTVNIYPWPTFKDFKEAFINMDIPDDELEIARQNLDKELLAERMENMPMNGSLNFKWQMQQRSNQIYYAGQSRMNNLSNLLNPIAWAKFIEAWKRGDFKRKD
jgi:hypothetical protein